MRISLFSRLIALGTLTLGLDVALAEPITPTRVVGPVSQYGQLMAGTNNDGKGRIYGSCAAYSTSGNEVQVKGMSLFWSNDETQNRYWRSDVITGEVNKQGIQLIRAAMAVDLQKWGNGHYFMNGKTEYYQDLLDETIQAAIENDIYVIIDYHSHIAAENVNRAKEFFKIQAKKWGAYDNVIFEIFNEPLCKPGHGAWADISGNMCNEYGGMITWSEIKAYAEEVIPVIRRYSDNLIVVGTPQWSARPGDVVGSAIDDPNVAYTLHFYAGFTDDGATSGYNTTNADNAISHGLSVFVTEWGTIGYDGAGTIGDPVNHSDAQNVSWQSWMNANKLSSANWNLGYNGTPNGETAAEYFTVNFDNTDPAAATWTYSASGQWVNQYVFAGLASLDYTQCTSYVALPTVPADDPSFDDSDDDFGDVYEDEVIPNDYVVEDFDGNGLSQWYYDIIGGGWTDDNGDEKSFWNSERESNVGGLVNLVTTEAEGWAGYGMHVSHLKGCQTLSYKYKGLAHDLVFANESAADVAVKSYEASSSWIMVSFDMSGVETSGVELDKALDIKWVIPGPADNESLYLDDVVCGDPYASSSSSSEEPASSSSFEEYTVIPNYDYAYAGGGWTIANPAGLNGIEATVYDDEMGGDFWGLKNVNTEEEGGYAGVGMNISNLNGCQVLSYQYIGIGHNLTFANTPDGVDVLAEWEIPSSNTWTTHTFNMSSLSGINLERELDIKWQVPGGENGNLYVKEIQCVLDGGSSSSSVGEESSSSVELPIVAEPTTHTELFDDFEDGDYMPLWEGVGNFWAETDVVGGGGSSNAELSFVKGSASAKALQMSYSLDVN